MDYIEELSDHSVVLAIDFGTAFSGYAYSFKSDPNRIYTNDNWAGNYVSLKAPTSILLDSNSKLQAFGYEAEEMYSERLMNECDSGWSLFRKFKMNLYKDEDPDNLMISDEKRLTKIPAIKVFEIAIRFLKEDAMERLETHNVKEEDVLIVLTVPAIWTDKARYFMREAGIRAGINSEKLVLALESETASVWCLDNQNSTTKTNMEPGQKFMVIDLGGGTADITVHEVTNKRELREVIPATGGDWGGVKVDKEFISMLTSVFGKDVMQRFRSECMYDVYDLIRQFEVTKRTITPESSGRISISLPAVLRKFNLESLKQSQRNFYKTLMIPRFADKLQLKGNKLRLEAEFAKGLFDYCCRSLSEHIANHPCIGVVDKVLCVGGFSECQLVRNALLSAVPTEIPIVFPPDAGLAVLKGAVKYGHKPSIITSRVAKFTYGYNKIVPWIDGQHPLAKRVILEGKFMCKDVFQKIVTKGTEVRNGFTIKQSPILPDDEHKLYAQCTLYLSTRDDPQFVTDVNCEKHGETKFKLPPESTVEERVYERSFVFLNTDLFVIVRHLKSNSVYKKRFNFL